MRSRQRAIATARVEFPISDLGGSHVGSIPEGIAMILLAIALFGLTVPNGLFLYWLIFEYNGLAAALQNKPAVALMIDALMALGLLAYYFAREPPGRFKWPWFVALSLIGGLGFSLPMYFWLNKRLIGAHEGSL